jgi:hypothetical protein
MTERKEKQGAFVAVIGKLLWSVRWAVVSRETFGVRISRICGFMSGKSGQAVTKSGWIVGLWQVGLTVLKAVCRSAGGGE